MISRCIYICYLLVAVFKVNLITCLPRFPVNKMGLKTYLVFFYVSISATEGLEPGGELAGAEEVSKRDKHEDLKGSGIIRKQKKHKKHKHKKRKRNRNAEWNKMNSESESGTKHLPR